MDMIENLPCKVRIKWTVLYLQWDLDTVAPQRA